MSGKRAIVVLIAVLLMLVRTSVAAPSYAIAIARAAGCCQQHCGLRIAQPACSCCHVPHALNDRATNEAPPSSAQPALVQLAAKVGFVGAATASPSGVPPRPDSVPRFLELRSLRL